MEGDPARADLIKNERSIASAFRKTPTILPARTSSKTNDRSRLRSERRQRRRLYNSRPRGPHQQRTIASAFRKTPTIPPALLSVRVLKDANEDDFTIPPSRTSSTRRSCPRGPHQQCVSRENASPPARTSSTTL